MVKNFGRKITRAIKKPVEKLSKSLQVISKSINKVKKVILKPIKVVLKLITNIIKLIVDFIKSIFLYITCVIKLLTNFHKCALYYFLDIIKYIFLSVVLFFAVTITALSKGNVKKVSKNIIKYWNTMKYSNSIMNDCYRCKAKKPDSTSIWDTLKKMYEEQMNPAERESPFNFFTIFMYCLLLIFIILFGRKALSSIGGLKRESQMFILLLIAVAFVMYVLSVGASYFYNSQVGLPNKEKGSRVDSKQSGLSFSYIIILLLALGLMCGVVYHLFKKISSPIGTALIGSMVLLYFGAILALYLYNLQGGDL